jgi:hypothetical protein
MADFGFGNRIKSENEAIRQLLEKGLSVAEEVENELSRGVGRGGAPVTASLPAP